MQKHVRKKKTKTLNRLFEEFGLLIWYSCYFLVFPEAIKFHPIVSICENNHYFFSSAAADETSGYQHFR